MEMVINLASLDIIGNASCFQIQVFDIGFFCFMDTPNYPLDIDCDVCHIDIDTRRKQSQVYTILGLFDNTSDMEQALA
ncbi:MAG: hypothetical protein NVS4B11_14770 [Ktedonobacteraceae bacterium]